MSAAPAVAQTAPTGLAEVSLACNPFQLTLRVIPEDSASIGAIIAPPNAFAITQTRLTVFLADNQDEVRIEVVLRWNNGEDQGTFVYGDTGLAARCSAGNDGPGIRPDFGLPGTDTIGFADPATAQWQLRRHDDLGGGTHRFLYGNPSDIPFIGDWDCDGVDTPGLFRQSDAFAYLRNSNTTGIADVRFFFGNPADVPLAGDWDGDGCDTLSIYRPSEQRFYIINELGSDQGGLGAADFSFDFGNPGDKPVVGDWDGDGADEFGLHRESTGFFYWRNSLDTGIASGQIFFGDPGDRFVAGDWGVVDGIDSPAVHRESAGLVFFRHTLTQGTADSSYPMRGDIIPLAGQFG